MKYRIKVTQLVESNQLDNDDLEDRPAGMAGKGSTLLYSVPDECLSRKSALDWFHSTVPIGVLDHFEIAVVRYEAKPRDKVRSVRASTAKSPLQKLKELEEST